LALFLFGEAAIFPIQDDIGSRRIRQVGSVRLRTHISKTRKE